MGFYPLRLGFVKTCNGVENRSCPGVPIAEEGYCDLCSGKRRAARLVGSNTVLADRGRTVSVRHPTISCWHRR